MNSQPSSSTKEHESSTMPSGKIILAAVAIILLAIAVVGIIFGPSLMTGNIGTVGINFVPAATPLTTFSSGSDIIMGEGGGTSSVSPLIPGIDKEEESVNVYTNARYPVNDIPKTIALWHSNKGYHSGMYVKDLRVENGKVKFYIQNFGNGNGQIGHLEVLTRTWGPTCVDYYYDVVIPSGKKRYFETRSVSILEDGNIDPSEEIFLKISV